MTFLVGVWLIISPLFMAYDKTAIPVIWGVVVLVLAVLRLVGGLASKTLTAITVAAGVLIVVTAFVTDDTSGPTANLALMGLAVIIFSVVGSAAPARTR